MEWWELQIWKIKYFLPAVLCGALYIHAIEHLNIRAIEHTTTQEKTRTVDNKMNRGGKY